MGYKIRIYMLLAATIPSGLAGMQARATDYDQLPDLGSSSATIISAREEQMVGDDFIRPISTAARLRKRPRAADLYK